jgi:hypothetical protein
MPTLSSEVALADFARRLGEIWLPTYCHDPMRRYDTLGFKGGLRSLTAHDAADFIYALDSGLVCDIGGGRYRAPRSKATEVLFWEGSKTEKPRSITLWLEPVITIAALARLRRDYSWPPTLLGLQSADWAFDLVAYVASQSDAIAIAGEVKKSASELANLVRYLQDFAADPAKVAECETGAKLNAARKWMSLAAARAPLFWAVGPDDSSQLFSVAYDEVGPRDFARVPLSALSYALDENETRPTPC